jgi:hypothetical protein
MIALAFVADLGQGGSAMREISSVLPAAAAARRSLGPTA